MSSACNYFFILCLISAVAGTISDEHRTVNESLQEDRLNHKLNALAGLDLQLPCKEVSLNYTDSYSPSYSIHDALSHGAVQRDSAGRLTHLVQRFAVQAEAYVWIRLMNKESRRASDIIYYIGIGWFGNLETFLQKHINGHVTTPPRIPTPGILSATEYRAFYVRIDNGTLEFGKEGEPPLISHVDVSLGSVKYLQFHKYGGKEAKIRFDCPAPVEY